MVEPSFGGPPIWFVLLFGGTVLLVVAVVVTMATRGAAQWSRNNATPVSTVRSRVVAKRGDTWGGAGDSSASTTHYATFELEGGDRVELQVPHRDFGLLAEGDQGRLTYQGTRFKGFERERQLR